MQFLTLPQIKQQLRIELDDTSEENHLTLIGEAAEAAIEVHLNRKLYANEVPNHDANGLMIKKTYSNGHAITRHPFLRKPWR